MRLPIVRGIIDRRILVNFRVDLEVLGTLLPAPFRPQVIGGLGIAGICLIRLINVRPKHFPAFIGIRSENAAHRIAVQWDVGNQVKTGVFIPRRDTSSWLNSVAGGRLFPGVHHRARFHVQENDNRFCVTLESHDQQVRLAFDGETTSSIPENSVFSSLDEASRFFEDGSLGYSPANKGHHFDGLELRSMNWHVQPLLANRVESSLFDEAKLFPPGSASFDSALLMRGIDHEWHRRDSLCASTALGTTDFLVGAALLRKVLGTLYRLRS